MSKPMDKIQARWQKLNPREKVICGVTGLLLVFLCSKMLVLDPYQKSEKILEATMVEKAAQLEAIGKERQKLALEAKANGQENYENELEDLKKKDVALNAQIGQAKSTVISGTQAFSLMQTLTKAAGVGLREISLPPKKARENTNNQTSPQANSNQTDKQNPDTSAEQKISMVYEHKIKVVMVGSWDNYKALLRIAKESSAALRLQSILFSHDEKGQTQMSAEFSALSLDESWTLPIKR